MAIIYSYPEEVNILGTDIVVGTTTKLINNRPKNETKNFSMINISNYVISNIPRGTLTTSNDQNITLTLGGVPADSLFKDVSITVGWTGLLQNNRIASASYWDSKQDALIGSGLVKSTNGTISYITDNSIDWDIAYDSKINSASVTGGATKTLTLNKQDGSTITASWEDESGLDGVGFVKANGTVISYDNSTYVPTSRTITINGVTKNLASNQDWVIATSNISLTTNGTSGPATLINDVLNIPNYNGGGNGVNSVNSGDSNQIDVDNSDPQNPILYANFGPVSNGSNNLVIGDDVYNFVTEYGFVENVSTQNSTFINLTNTGTPTAPYLTASLSATGIPSSTSYLRGDNTWATLDSSYIWYLGGNIGTEPNVVENGAVVNLFGGDMITTDHSGGNSNFLINHDTQTRIDTTSNVSPGFGSTFTVIDSVTSSPTGHISAVNLKTVTLPSAAAQDVQNTVKAGVTINKGQAVYVTGADGTNIIVGLASNTSEATSSKTLGLLNATVAVNGFADVIQIGKLAGLDTSSAAIGDPVWLGTNGNLIYGLANKPYAPAHLVYIGVVTRVNANNGEIFVTVQNGFELKEIHDVDLVTNVPVNGDILGYDGVLWVNKTIAEWLGYTPANDVNVVHKTGDETITGVKTFSNNTAGDSIVSANSSSGVGINSSNTSTGNGIRSINSSTGNGIVSINTDYGNGIVSTNISSGSGILLNNGGDGTGITLNNGYVGIGMSIVNSTTGKGIASSNLSSGDGIYSNNSSTGIGAFLNNALSGKNLVLNNTTAATGMPFTIQKNNVDKLTINDNGDISIQDAIISYSENLSISAPGGLVYTTDAANASALFFEYVAKNGSNLRAGTIMVCFDLSTFPIGMQYTETSTMDIGDTSGLVLEPQAGVTGVDLYASATTSGWSVKTLVKKI